MERLVTVSSASEILHAGQRLAKPGLSGFSSNSSEQTVQTLMGKGMASLIITETNNQYAGDELKNFRDSLSILAQDALMIERR
jgi:hypothetical protein